MTLSRSRKLKVVRIFYRCIEKTYFLGFFSDCSGLCCRFIDENLECCDVSCRDGVHKHESPRTVSLADEDVCLPLSPKSNLRSISSSPSTLLTRIHRKSEELKEPKKNVAISGKVRRACLLTAPIVGFIVFLCLLLPFLLEPQCCSFSTHRSRPQITLHYPNGSPPM